MRNRFIESTSLANLKILQKISQKRKLVSFYWEITARCNNRCRHCYNALTAGDKLAQKKELTLGQIKDIAHQSVGLGALWCSLTGGEPLLREDFLDIYLSLKKAGLLVSIFTNATLITKEHVRVFKKYPPRDIEVTVYGVTRETYERVSRNPGSFLSFKRGVALLRKENIPIRFKAMALHSNSHELPVMAQAYRKITKDYFRFDPFLCLRIDGNPGKNNQIKSERLLPAEIASLERNDPERFTALKNNCSNLINDLLSYSNCRYIFQCGAGISSVYIGYDGRLRLCSALSHPDCVYDLAGGSLSDAWENFIPKIRSMTSANKDFLKKCKTCSIINLCMWCPAHTYLETGALDKPVEYFCAVAHARAQMLGWGRINE